MKIIFTSFDKAAITNLPRALFPGKIVALTSLKIQKRLLMTYLAIIYWVWIQKRAHHSSVVRLTMFRCCR